MSLLDDEEDLIENNYILIQNFLKKNYRIYGNISIKNNIVDIKGDVHLMSNIKSLTNGLFSFGYVEGDFECGESELISLEGAPKEVGGYFACDHCYSLKSLEGAPEKVKGDFNCNYCVSLMSLKGAPKEVGRHFNCRNCRNLTSLEGAPEKVGGSFDCSWCDSLISLKGAPHIIKGLFKNAYCPKLTQLSRKH